jgi:hypothetical protein
VSALLSDELLLQLKSNLPEQLELPRTNVEFQICVTGAPKLDELRIGHISERQLRTIVKTIGDVVNISRKIGFAKQICNKPPGYT